jgi:hypothetical protein
VVKRVVVGVVVVGGLAAWWLVGWWFGTWAGVLVFWLWIAALLVLRSRLRRAAK